jgi:hypothetical protein
MLSRGQAITSSRISATTDLSYFPFSSGASTTNASVVSSLNVKVSKKYSSTVVAEWLDTRRRASWMRHVASPRAAFPASHYEVPRARAASREADP